VTAFRSGISRQLSEIDGYYSGRSTGKEGTAESNEDRIKELSDADEQQEEWQGASSAEEAEENEMEEERRVLRQRRLRIKVGSHAHAGMKCLRG
jgi:hypothetical protein